MSSLVRRYCPKCKIQWTGSHGDNCHICGYQPTREEVIVAIIMGYCDSPEEVYMPDDVSGVDHE